MAGFASVDNPQITIFATIDEPSNGAYYAGVVTAPLGKELFQDIFNYMNQEFSQDENVILKDVVLPEVRGVSVSDAKKILKELNINCTVEGDGDTITNMQPYPGYDVKEGSTINLYTNQNETYNKDVIMPDVRGYSKKAAIELLEELVINYTIQGDGVIINQSIPSGELISKGTTVKLTLSAEYEED